MNYKINKSDICIIHPLKLTIFAKSLPNADNTILEKLKKLVIIERVISNNC